MAALLWLATASWGQPPGSIPPIYTQQLQVPVRGDGFAQPSAVVADLHTGEIFVCDSRRNRVVIFDEKGRFRYQIPGGTTFVSPIDLAVDSEGYLFVLGQVSPEIALLDFDGRLIRKISLAGLPEDAASPRFASLALSPEGETLYAIDTENHRLWITSRDGVIRHSIDMTVGRTAEEIDALRYGHIDVYGETLLVPIPTDGLVHLYNLDGSAKGTVGDMGSAECQTMFPAAAALDEAGRVLILDQQRALFMTWDLERGVCLSEHYGFGNAPGALYQPGDLALDAAGRLYVSQGFEGRVQVYEGARRAPLLLAAHEPQPATPEELPVAEDPTVVAQSEVVPKPSPAEPLRPVVQEEAVAATAEEDSLELGFLIAAGAGLSIERAPRYDATYAEIGYPGGDVAGDRGAAIDVVIRAFRHAGIDLQQAVHEDVAGAFSAYRINEPDPNIDHRRMRNLVVFFGRQATSLSVERAADWAAGDVVFWDRKLDGVADHVGVVTAETGSSGNPLVIHHHRRQGEFSGTPGADDVLVRWPVLGHYRWSVEYEGPDLGLVREIDETPDAVLPEVAPAPQVLEAAPLEPLVGAATDVDKSRFGALLDEGARQSVARAPRYDASYAEIDYPGGDVPADRGAAIDVVIRAFRNAGIDLQEAVHEDVAGALGVYGINEPDPSIDHRRMRNLVVFFSRQAKSLSGAPSRDWAAGDVVFWDRNSDGVADHVGIVTTEAGSSDNPLVVHHHQPQGEFSGAPATDDVLFRWPVRGHYRWLLEDEGPVVEEPVKPLPAEPMRPVVQEEAEAATAEVGSLGLGSVIAAGARLSIERAPRYDASYGEIDYPGGDVPADRGAAIDVVIRALRHAGVDLQEAVHEDVVGALDAYSVNEPDSNIDHRRMRNLVVFFSRQAMSLSIEPAADWAAGDVVFWDKNSDGVADHVGIVTAEAGSSGNPLVVHHHRQQGEFSGTPGSEDVLFRWPVLGHYRWSLENEGPVVRTNRQ